MFPRPFMRSLVIRPLIVLGLAVPMVAAQAPTVTRRDLADAYLTMDRAVRRRGLPDSARAEVNAAFDRTTLAFFGGRYATVLRDMHALLARVEGDTAAGGETRTLLPLRLRAEPRVLVPARDARLVVSVTPMYTDSAAPVVARTYLVRVRSEEGREVARVPLEVPAGTAPGARVEVTIETRGLALVPGRLNVSLEREGGRVQQRTSFFVSHEPVASIRTRLLAALDALAPRTDAQALDAVRARAALLVDQPADDNTAQFLADPVRLADEIAGEVRALEAGGDPFRGRVGGYWRTMQVVGGPVAMRIHVPPAARRGTPLPVVVALHGAGADENMFLEGYGAGRIAALADSLGFIVISPATTAFMRDPAALDSALAVVGRSHPVDRARVTVVGHSMGGGATVRLATTQRQRLRAAAVIAGAGAAPADGAMAPTLFVAASVDPIIPATRVRASAEQARQSGVRMELWDAFGWGHTLVVGAYLDRVVAWLLAQ